MTSLTPMKRIEILLEEGMVPMLAEMVAECGFSGHTVMPVLAGAGGRGGWRDERLTSSRKVMLLAIGPKEDCDRLIAKIEPMLGDYRMLLTVGDVEVIRKDRF